MAESACCPNCGRPYERPRFGLTKRQKVLCDFIAGFTSENNRWPSYAEMCCGTGIKSKSNIHQLLEAADAKGLLVFQGKHEGRRKNKQPPGPRELEMREHYEAGKTLPAIAEQFGISPERVRQILHNHFGLNGNKGGRRILSDKKRAERKKLRDAHYMARWGHDEETHKEFVNLGRELGARYEKQPLRAYSSQKQGAKVRGIEWKFKFSTWWKFWQDSGKWHLRGSGVGRYVMGRFGDEGPYSPENCYITLWTENIKHYFDHRRGDMHEFSTPRSPDP